MTPPENDLRGAVADPALRKEVRDCICETIPLRGRWVSAIIAGPITRLLTRALAAETDLAKARADLERVTAERDEARATNRRLHRRLQAAEGPMQSRLHFQKWLLDYRFRAFARVRRRALVAEAENTRLRALLVDAGEALRPFAAGANTADADAEAIFFPQARHPDDTTIDPILPSGEMPKLCELGDLRRARSTLAALDKAPTPKDA